MFLYRPMFVLYAEARELIHPEDPSTEDEYTERIFQNANGDVITSVLDVPQTIHPMTFSAEASRTT